MILLKTFLYTLFITQICNSSQSEIDKDIVVKYLQETGYLPEGQIHPGSSDSKHNFRKAIRMFQRENSLIVNGRLTQQVINTVKKENDEKIVVNYLKTYNYIIGVVTPLKIKSAVEKLQKNTGYLIITGEIDNETIQFIKNHPSAFSEMPYPDRQGRSRRSDGQSPSGYRFVATRRSAPDPEGIWYSD